MSDLQKSVIKELEKSNVDEGIQLTVGELLEEKYMNLFDGLETTHLQTKFFQDNFSLLVRFCTNIRY